jgi:TPR repeat protein
LLQYQENINYEHAFIKDTEAAVQYDSSAQFGYLYGMGLGTAHNSQPAIHWYKKPGNVNHNSARYNI